MLQMAIVCAAVSAGNSSLIVDSSLSLPFLFPGLIQKMTHLSVWKYLTECSTKWLKESICISDRFLRSTFNL